MNIRKKWRFRDYLRVALVLLLFFAVPLWVFMIATITGSVVAWLVLIVWVSIFWRF